MEVRNRAEKYKNQSKRYFDNAIRLIEAGEAEKAGELLWGSLSQAIKAVAASNSRELRTHDDIRAYTLELTRKMEDEGIWYAFITAQFLHSRFYETGLNIEDVKLGAETIRRILDRLRSISSATGK